MTKRKKVLVLSVFYALFPIKVGKADMTGQFAATDEAQSEKVWYSVFVSLRRDKSGKKTAHLLSSPDSTDVLKSRHTFSNKMTFLYREQRQSKKPESDLLSGFLRFVERQLQR